MKDTAAHKRVRSTGLLSVTGKAIQSLRRIAVVGWLVMSVVCGYAASEAELYAMWMQLPAEQLMQIGDDYLNERQWPDSAIICYTIVANRYNRRMSRTEKQYCKEAYNRRFILFFSHYFDYAQSYESLVHAMEISSNLGEDDPRLHLNMGFMYQALAEQGADAGSYRDAIDSYRTSFRYAMTAGEWRIAENAFVNMVASAWTVGTLDSLESEWAVFRDHDSLAVLDYHRVHGELYLGVAGLSRHAPDEAIGHLSQVISLLPESAVNSRYHCAAYSYLADAYRQKGDMTKAEQMLWAEEGVIGRWNLRDVETDLLRQQQLLYTDMGQTQKAHDKQFRYYQLRDSLANYQMVSTVRNMQFMREVHSLADMLGDMRQRHLVQTMALAVTTFVLLAIAVVLLIVYRKNQSLRQRNRALYQRSIQLMALEQKEREQREKYGANKLPNDVTDELWHSIQHIMETNRQVYDEDFSIEKLVGLVGTNVKYVSQVINQCYGQNFSTLLSDCRVKEACQRINDVANYGNVTLEGIQHSVGIKSRTTFSNSFKRATGLTPSEYLRQARASK